MRALATALIALLLPSDLVASQPMPPMTDPTYGEIPPSSAEPWIVLAVLGRRNQPIPVTFFMTQKIETKPSGGSFTYWVPIKSDVFQWMAKSAPTQSCGRARDIPRDPNSPSGGNWLEISERDKGRWVHLCFLTPADAMTYLSGLIANPIFDWSPERSEGIRLVIHAYREGYLN